MSDQCFVGYVALVGSHLGTLKHECGNLKASNKYHLVQCALVWIKSGNDAGPMRQAEDLGDLGAYFKHRHPSLTFQSSRCILLTTLALTNLLIATTGVVKMIDMIDDIRSEMCMSSGPIRLG